MSKLPIKMAYRCSANPRTWKVLPGHRHEAGPAFTAATVQRPHLVILDLCGSYIDQHVSRLAIDQTSELTALITPSTAAVHLQPLPSMGHTLVWHSDGCWRNGDVNHALPYMDLIYVHHINLSCNVLCAMCFAQAWSLLACQAIQQLWASPCKQHMRPMQ